MYQTIVLSPTILRFLEKGLSHDEALDLLKQLRRETIILDENGVLDEEYLALIENSPKAKFLKEIWADLRTKLNFKHISICLNQRHISDFEKLESEANLAGQTTWKIVVADAVSSSTKLDLAQRLNIEASDINNYLCPPQLSRIRAIQKYELKRGETFDFKGWILKFLKDAQSLEIADGYVCTQYPLQDLKYILQNVNPGISVQILTLSDEARQGKKPDRIVVSDELTKLKNSYPSLKVNWKIYKDKKDLHDRWIKTDRFEIELGKGLGFVDARTNSVKGQTRITVQPIS